MRAVTKTTIVIAIAWLGVVVVSATAWAVPPATDPAAPEIGATALPAAMGLLGAGVLMLRARWGRK